MTKVITPGNYIRYIMETEKEFKSIFWDKEIEVYADEQLKEPVRSYSKWALEIYREEKKMKIKA